ncbi:hypothetical protein [Lysobacter sp. CA196]|uniref:hypothetical protein n=1 Tax=Lysobacter sp. CA196 TaxID=3455606 RepID=UPI003F8D637C
MAGPTKTTPPAPDPKPGRNPGYPEPQPRDPDDARQPHPRKPPNPDEGGLERKPESGPDPTDR